MKYYLAANWAVFTSLHPFIYATKVKMVSAMCNYLGVFSSVLCKQTGHRSHENIIQKVFRQTTNFKWILVTENKSCNRAMGQKLAGQLTYVVFCKDWCITPNTLINYINTGTDTWQNTNDRKCESTKKL